MIFVSEPEEQADVEEGSGRNNESSEDGDFQVSKKRYRTPGMQVIIHLGLLFKEIFGIGYLIYVFFMIVLHMAKIPS